MGLMKSTSRSFWISCLICSRGLAKSFMRPIHRPSSFCDVKFMSEQLLAQSRNLGKGPDKTPLNSYRRSRSACLGSVVRLVLKKTG